MNIIVANRKRAGQNLPSPTANNAGYELVSRDKGSATEALETKDTENTLCEDIIETDVAATNNIDNHRRNCLGVSVRYLQTGFLKEIEEAGLSRNSVIYDIENLRGPPGVIRRKGEQVVSPTDGRLGASYVDCLEGDDHVGIANGMLSYTWG